MQNRRNITCGKCGRLLWYYELETHQCKQNKKGLDEDEKERILKNFVKRNPKTINRTRKSSRWFEKFRRRKNEI